LTVFDLTPYVFQKKLIVVILMSYVLDKITLK